MLPAVSRIQSEALIAWGAFFWMGAILEDFPATFVVIYCAKAKKNNTKQAKHSLLVVVVVVAVVIVVVVTTLKTVQKTQRERESRKRSGVTPQSTHA